MGSVRIGTLQRTRPWREVVGQIQDGADAAGVAAATVRAAARGLADAGSDRGVVEATHLLLLLSDAARSGDLAANLYRLGVTVPSSPGLIDLVCGFTEAVDARLPNNEGRTDLGEMAQMAGAETLAGRLGTRTRGLFDAAPEAVAAAVRELATPAGSGAFFRAYFARLVYKVLDYFLSRELASHVGGAKRFVGLARLSAFCRSLEQHCFESAAVVETFAADWTSLTRYRDGGVVSRDRARDFAHGCVAKILQVLGQEGGSRGQ